MTNPETEPVCKFEQGCHRVVPCDPGCGTPVVPPPMSRPAKAEALLLRFTAEAHRRKWNYDRGLDGDGVPVKSEAFDALHRLGEEMRVALEELRRVPAAVSVPPPATRADDQAALRDRAAEAIRAAACPGSDCRLSEAECSEQRIQPAAWERGVLSEVYGRPEWFADAVLAVLPPAVSGPCVAGEQQNETPEAEAPTTTKPETDEDPARIDRLRPEFFEHASVESIDFQIQRAQRQQLHWGNRERTLAILRQARVMQKEHGEWPAAVVGQDGAQQ